MIVRDRKAIYCPPQEQIPERETRKGKGSSEIS